MTVRVRPAIVLTALAAAAAPAAVAVLLSGSAAAVSLPAVAAATSTNAAANTVAAEIVAAPQAVTLAAPVVARPATKPTAVKRVAAAHAVRTVTRQVAVAVAAPAKVTPAAPRPVAAPKPAPTTTTTTTSTRTGDDYPYARATTSDNDAWGFTKRQCVSFAAFRLSQHGNTLNNSTQNWGSALSWDEAAPRNGASVTSTPKVGAIAQWNAGESSRIYSSTGAQKGSFSAGSYGHVGYVAAVYSDGTVLVEQYNLGGDRSYTAMRMSAPRYLVF